MGYDSTQLKKLDICDSSNCAPRKKSPFMKIVVILLLVMCSIIGAQELSPLASNAPKDKPISAEDSKLNLAIAPYVAKAKETYPEARKRYVAGLPAKHIFFLVLRIIPTFSLS